MLLGVWLGYGGCAGEVSWYGAARVAIHVPSACAEPLPTMCTRRTSEYEPGVGRRQGKQPCCPFSWHWRSTHCGAWELQHDVSVGMAIPQGHLAHADFTVSAVTGSTSTPSVRTCVTDDPPTSCITAVVFLPGVLSSAMGGFALLAPQEDCNFQVAAYVFGGEGSSPHPPGMGPKPTSESKQACFRMRHRGRPRSHCEIGCRVACFRTTAVVGEGPGHPHTLTCVTLSSGT